MMMAQKSPANKLQCSSDAKILFLDKMKKNENICAKFKRAQLNLALRHLSLIMEVLVMHDPKW